MRTSFVHKTTTSLDSSHCNPSSVEFRSVNITPNPTYHPSRPNPLVPFQVRLRSNVRNNGEAHKTPSSLSHSTICPSGDSRRANGVILTTRIAARGRSFFSTIVTDRPKTSFLSSSFASSHSRGSECIPVMRYPPTFHDSFSGIIPRAQLGSSGYMTASATAPEEFGNESYEWSADGTEAREHAGHANNGWKGDSSAKAVLMFVSPLRLVLALITVLIYSKRPAFFPQSSRHLSWKATKCCHPELETGHRFLLAKSLMDSLMSQVAQVAHCRPAQYPLLLPHLSMSTSCG